MSWHSQTASFAAWVIATYSASVIKSETSSCFLELQEIAPPSIMNVYPEIARLCSSDMPSASEYPSNPFFPLAPYAQNLGVRNTGAPAAVLHRRQHSRLKRTLSQVTYMTLCCKVGQHYSMVS
jgi:hypothetical protein